MKYIDINCFSLQTCQSNQWSKGSIGLLSTATEHQSSLNQYKRPQQWDASEWLSISKIHSWLTEDFLDTLLYSSMLGYLTSVTHRWAGLYTVPTKKWPFSSRAGEASFLSRPRKPASSSHRRDTNVWEHDGGGKIQFKFNLPECNTASCYLHLKRIEDTSSEVGRHVLWTFS